MTGHTITGSPAPWLMVAAGFFALFLILVWRSE